jgi:hypothetical protein
VIEGMPALTITKIARFSSTDLQIAAREIDREITSSPAR